MNSDLKIFGLGLSRTGTTSLGLGLGDLGFNVIHFPIDVYSKNDQTIFDKFDAFVDLPIPLYYKELDKRFPGSKFILTTRDETKWLASMKWMLTEGRIIWRQGPIHDKLHMEVYGTKKYTEEMLLEKYRAYNAEVIEYFKNRSQDFIHLNIEKKELNYQTICSFLNMPVVSGVFPMVNEKRKASLWNKIEHGLWYRFPIYRKIRYIVLRRNKK